MVQVIMSAIRGKSKSLDYLYLVWGIHDIRHNQSSLIKKLLDPDWSSEVKKLLMMMSASVAELDGISLKTSLLEVEKSFA